MEVHRAETSLTNESLILREFWLQALPESHADFGGACIVAIPALTFGPVLGFIVLPRGCGN